MKKVINMFKMFKSNRLEKIRRKNDYCEYKEVYKIAGDWYHEGQRSGRDLGMYMVIRTLLNEKAIDLDSVKRTTVMELFEDKSYVEAIIKAYETKRD